MSTSSRRASACSNCARVSERRCRYAVPVGIPTKRALVPAESSNLGFRHPQTPMRRYIMSSVFRHASEPTRPGHRISPRESPAHSHRDACMSLNHARVPHSLASRIPAGRRMHTWATPHLLVPEAVTLCRFARGPRGRLWLSRRATIVLVLDWDSSRSGHARFFSNKVKDAETYFILASS